jgi:hypothetical protein
MRIFDQVLKTIQQTLKSMREKVGACYFNYYFFNIQSHIYIVLDKYPKYKPIIVLRNFYNSWLGIIKWVKLYFSV